MFPGDDFFLTALNVLHKFLMMKFIKILFALVFRMWYKILAYNYGAQIAGY